MHLEYVQNVVWHRPAEIHQDFLQSLLPCSINGAFIDVQVTCTVPYFELCSTSFCLFSGEDAASMNNLIDHRTFKKMFLNFESVLNGISPQKMVSFLNLTPFFFFSQFLIK